MLTLGLIREGKVPPDTRVALTPAQCRFLLKGDYDLDIMVQQSPNRCYTNTEYQKAGVTLTEDLSSCDVLLGIKEVPLEMLIPNKTYLFSLIPKNYSLTTRNSSKRSSEKK